MAKLEGEVSKSTQTIKELAAELESARSETEKKVSEATERVEQKFSSLGQEIRETKKQRDTLFGECLLLKQQSEHHNNNHYYTLSATQRRKIGEVRSELHQSIASSWQESGVGMGSVQQTPPSARKRRDESGLMSGIDIVLPPAKPQPTTCSAKATDQQHLDELEKLAVEALENI